MAAESPTATDARRAGEGVFTGHPPVAWRAAPPGIPRPPDPSPGTTTGRVVRSADALPSAATP
ncbi:hypothetical protein M8C17_07295 [Micromonospora sp. RHAY321]|uniref:hypothetical protein n=1 Tax=Micromonospora sp. RHAY321 TaxID=2944807 RepID=UPI00207CE8CD|nr:hypothetical protein [Micromonospora sp. RHAY321]MCO1594966.1 hypothetical protein [Micromonospora sp. RHAY321]